MGVIFLSARIKKYRNSGEMEEIMKVLQRSFYVCAAAALLIFAASCTGSDEPPPQQEATPEPAAAATPAPAPEPAPPPAPESAIPGLPFATAEFAPGTYTATAESYGGPLTVSVSFSENQITDITVTEHSDSLYGSGWMLRAYPAVPDQIFVRQSTQDIDAFTGATITRDAVIEAVEDAIRQAGAAPEDLMPQFIAAPLPGDLFIPGYHEITVPANTMDIEGNPLAEGAMRMLYCEDTDMNLRVSFGRNMFHLHSGGARGLGQGDGGHGESVYPGEIVGGTWGGWWFRQVVNHQINDHQSTHVDIETGATMSAAGIRWGVEQAMIAAGADPAAIRPQPVPPTQIVRANPDARFFVPGVYEATAEGFGGELTAFVTLDRSTIRRIVISEHNETDSFWEQVWPDIRDMIYEEQTTNIEMDAFAGATLSASAVIDAVRNVMIQAGETNEDNH